MLVFLLIVGLCGAVLFPKVHQAFWENPFLNGLILAVLAVGIMRAFGQVIRLYPEIRWVNAFRIADPGLAIEHKSVLAFNAYTPWPSFYALLPVLGTCLVILAGCGDGGWLANPALQRLGAWSYSIYLWHWPMVVLLRETGLGAEPLWVIAGIIGSIALGALSFHWVERPARSFKGGQRGWEILAVAGLGGAIVTGSVAIYAADGLPERAGQNQALLLDAMAAPKDRETPANCSGLASGRLRSCPDVSSITERVAVVGDSHAMVWYPRYGAVVEGRAEFFLHYLCPPFPTYADRTLSSCSRFNELVLDKILNGPYRRVVFVSFWVPYLEIYAPKACRTSEDGCQPLGSEAEEDRLFEDFYAAIGRLVQAGRQVVIVLPIPAPHFDVPKAVRDRIFSGRSHPGLDGVELAARAPAEDRVRAKLKRAEQRGATIVDPRTFMCRDGRCPVLAEDGRPLYSDGNHLRPWVVRERLDFLDAYIKGDPPSVAAIRK